MAQDKEYVVAVYLNEEELADLELVVDAADNVLDWMELDNLPFDEALDTAIHNVCVLADIDRDELKAARAADRREREHG